MELVEARVKWQAGRVIETTYGKRINVVVSTLGGEEVTLWANPGDEPYVSLKKGDLVQLVKDSKGYKLVQSKLSNAPEEKIEPEYPWTDGYKRSLVAKIDQHGDLLKHCLKISKEKFTKLVDSEESLRALATSLYIQAVRD